ncbi:uncharacterized protein LTR77_000392 [Saxophila tyrrhenica]|uniref:RRM domain-containing protein n=1 Tax=Saxophila tyrrhenica TaxID=1690608 RepID=A0AAV9PR61_9PEZI|nr:hypothetical protein LTR77_000392 [Saxophila tyrrhenica]
MIPPHFMLLNPFQDIVLDMDRIYVGNLPYQAQREDIEFKVNGILMSKLDMSIDPFTGRNPSYCFVDLLPADARLAVETLAGQDVRGRPVKVSSYTEKRRRQTSMVQPKTYSWGCAPSDPLPSRARPPKYVFDKWHDLVAKNHWTLPCDEGRRLWVGGLPRIDGARAINAEMRDLFQGFGIQAVSKIIPTQPWPGTKFVPGYHYYCFVDVMSAEKAKEAVAALDRKLRAGGGEYRVRIADRTTR